MFFISPEGNYPAFYGDIMVANPGFEIGDPLPKGWVEVKQVEYPEIDKYEIAEEEQPQEIDGIMTQIWSVREMTAEEKERVDAPENAKAKLRKLGLTDAEIEALSKGLV